MVRKSKESEQPPQYGMVYKRPQKKEKEKPKIRASPLERNLLTGKELKYKTKTNLIKIMTKKDKIKFRERKRRINEF